MSIDEVIEKYKEITNPNTICLAHCDMFCDKCVQESEQLVEWLEELKALRDNNYKDFYYDKGYSKAENDYHKQSENDRQSAYELGYINAIDDFKKEIIDMVNNSPTVENDYGEIRPMNIEEICEITIKRLNTKINDLYKQNDNLKNKYLQDLINMQFEIRKIVKNNNLYSKINRTITNKIKEERRVKIND